MKTLLAIVVLSFVAVSCGGGDNGGAIQSPTNTATASPSGSASTTAIAVSADDKLRFVPASITVPVGTPVQWTVTGTVPHTVTAKSGATFDSGKLTQAQTFTQTFTAAATIKYFCTIHGSVMSGTITVTP